MNRGSKNITRITLNNGRWGRRLLAGILLTPLFLQPCTTLSFNDNNHVRIFGKAFDWFDAHGMVVVNKRNMRKAALIVNGGDPLDWTSKYGSVTFNQHGREFPLGGMNEKGLVVEIMTGPTQDIADGPGLKSLNEVQLIQFMLDSFAKVDELKSGLAGIRISRVMSDVHYLVCDVDNDCSTVEFLDGALVLHQGADLPYKVFTNSSYADSAAYAAQFVGLGGQQLVPSDSASLSRFARAAKLVADYAGQDAVPYVQNFLDQVALSGRWRITYKGNREIYFRNEPNLTPLKKISVNFDFSCKSPVQVFRLDSPGEGDITAAFTPYSQAQNDWLVGQNAMLPSTLRETLRTYPDTNTVCLEN